MDRSETKKEHRKAATGTTATHAKPSQERCVSFGTYKTFPNEGLSHEVLKEQNPDEREHPQGEKEERFFGKTAFDGGNSFNDGCVRPEERKSRKKVYIYDIYGIHNQSIKDFLQNTQNEVKITRSIKVPPTAWEAFKYWVARADPSNSMSDRITDFIIQYVIHAAEDRHQPKITQFFINKPNVVNISEKQLVKVTAPQPLPDFSKMSDEKLQELYDKAVAQHEYARSMTLAFEIKKRRGFYHAR